MTLALTARRPTPPIETRVDLLAAGGDRSALPAVLSSGAERSATPRAPRIGALRACRARLRITAERRCRFHLESGNPQQPTAARHACAMANGELIQCAPDGADADDAHLIGIEARVGADAFGLLPPEKCKLWHRHAFEVGSGHLVVPGLPSAAEHALMEMMPPINGRAPHADRGGAATLGIPQLNPGFIANGRPRRDFGPWRDGRLGVPPPTKKPVRGNVQRPPVGSGADAGQSVAAPPFELKPAGS